MFTLQQAQATCADYGHTAILLSGGGERDELAIYDNDSGRWRGSVVVVERCYVDSTAVYSVLS